MFTSSSNATNSSGEQRRHYPTFSQFHFTSPFHSSPCGYGYPLTYIAMLSMEGVYAVSIEMFSAATFWIDFLDPSAFGTGAEEAFTLNTYSLNAFLNAGWDIP